MSPNLHEQEISMLRAELELLMKERQALMQVAGAAAGFIAEPPMPAENWNDGKL